MATSTPQPSMSNGMVPSDAMVSTASSARWPAASMALRMAGMSLTTPEAVSTCTVRTALIAPDLSARRRASSAAGSTARRQSPGKVSTCTPRPCGRAPPGGGEQAALEHEDRVAAREQIAERRLPGAVAVGDVDVGLPARAEQLLQVGQAAGGDVEQRAGIDVDSWAMHGGEDFVGHRGGAGYAQKFAAVADGHRDRLSCVRESDDQAPSTATSEPRETP